MGTPDNVTLACNQTLHHQTQIFHKFHTWQQLKLSETHPGNLAQPRYNMLQRRSVRLKTQLCCLN